MKVLQEAANLLGTQLGAAIKSPDDNTNPFYKIKAEVQYLEHDITSKDLTGPEKKAKVLQSLENIGLEVGGIIVNLLIELAAFYIKSKVPVPL